MPQPIPQRADVVIEFPSIGATYRRQEYGVYAYDEYPRSSVLSGQTRRSFIASFPTLEEAQKEYPTAEVSGPGYEAPYVNHLPGEDDDEEEYNARHPGGATPRACPCGRMTINDCAGECKVEHRRIR